MSQLIIKSLVWDSSQKAKAAWMKTQFLREWTSSLLSSLSLDHFQVQEPVLGAIMKRK